MKSPDRDAADEPYEKRLVAYGYAAGSYMNTCGDCKDKFIGDKRALLCRACASERKNTAQASELATLRRRVAEIRAETLEQAAVTAEAWVHRATIFGGAYRYHKECSRAHDEQIAGLAEAIRNSPPLPPGRNDG